MWDRIRNYVHVGLIGLVIFAIGYYKGCKKEKTKLENNISNTVKTNVKICSIPGSCKNSKSNNLPSIGYVPPEGNITIKSKVPGKSLNDLVEIKRHEAGILPGEFGLQTSFIQPSIGLDTKLAYFGRWGINLGILGSSKFAAYVSPTVSISYRLDRISFIHNTELWLGFVPLAQYNIQAGLRLNL